MVGYTLGWCIAGYGREATLVYIPGWVGREATLVYMHPVPWWVYTVLPMFTLYTPGYTPYIPPLPVYRSSCPVRCSLPGERALGSKEEKPVGEEPLRVLRALILLGLLCPDAHRALLSPARKGERSDSDRVSSHVFPYVTVMCARWWSFRPSDR